MSAAERFVEALEARDCRPHGRNGVWVARCPAHDDRSPSLSVTAKADKVLINCHAGCTHADIVSALGLEVSELFDESSSTSTRPELVATYDYTDEAGKLLSQVLRYSPKGFKQRRADGTWKLGDTRRVIYRLPEIVKAIEQGQTIVVVEGEKDADALWKLKIPATCNAAGAMKWSDSHTRSLAGAEVLIVADRDEQGRAHARDVAAKLQGVAKEINVFEPSKGKDMTEHLQAGGNPVLDLVPLELEGGGSPGNGATVQHLPEDPWEHCAELAGETRILDRFERDLARVGLVGENRCAKLIYLCATSRLMERPVSIAVKGPSSGGKSYTVERVLDFFPHQAYHSLTASSSKAMIYSEEPLQHRMLVLFEAAGSNANPDSEQDYFVRSLLSEGRLRYETVDSTKDGLKGRLIEREGPTGLIITTTQVSLHPENETRLISITVKDTPDQTRRVMLALADEGSGADVDLLPWESLQDWLWLAEPREVTIPFSKLLAESIPPAATRLRRDFGALLTLIRTHAFLHRANRDVDERDRVIALVDDYAVVRDLVADLFDEGVEKGVSPEVRETVGKIAELNAKRSEQDQGVSGVRLAAELDLDKGTVSRRVSVALKHGYVRNLEERRGRPARYVIGDPLPSVQHLLPPPGQLSGGALHGCTVAGGDTGGSV